MLPVLDGLRELGRLQARARDEVNLTGPGCRAEDGVLHKTWDATSIIVENPRGLGARSEHLESMQRATRGSKLINEDVSSTRTSLSYLARAATLGCQLLLQLS